MPKLYLFFLILLGLSTRGPAQLLTGTVTDQASGEALPYASIYVQETGTGATSNVDGRYELRLREGINTVVFQYLGYQTEVIKVERGRTTLDVALRSEALDLDPVEVLSGAEDLSYSVIRRAIAKADYHRNQVDRYSADVYLKGNGKVTKIPKLLLAMAPKEDREEAKEIVGKNFTSETTSKVTYTRPNTYSEEVISKYVVGEENFDVSGYVFATFYQPEIADIISPLAPKSFAYYKFEHEGVFVDQDELINKIKVIPRSRGEDVFEGYVYIVQDDWSLHSVELRTYRLGFAIDVTQNYNEIQEHLWMPTTTRFYADGGFVGVKFSFEYVAVASNYDVTLNPELGGYVEVIDEKTQPEVAAATKRENRVAGYEQKLEEGGELTAKELRKLLREYEREERKASEEPEVIGNYTFKNDSVQVIRDTSAWLAVRPIPLTQDEIDGYKFQDSLATANRLDSIAIAQGDKPAKKGSDSSKPRRNNFFTRLDWRPDAQFNPVEGYALGAKLISPIRFRLQGEGDTASLRKVAEFSVRSRYGFSWRRLSWEVGLENWWQGTFKNRYRPRFGLSGGRYLRQFDATPAIDPLINSFTALIWNESYTRLYERSYGRLRYWQRFSEAFYVSASATYEDRRAVRNTTNQSWGEGDEFAYAPNTPINAERGIIDEVANAAKLGLVIQWRPGLKYIYRNGEKRQVRNSAPDLTFRAIAGLPDIGESQSDFLRLEAGIEHRFELGRKGKVDLLLRGGIFAHNDFVDFPDFKHFATSEILLTRLDPIGSYRLLPYYLNSTGEEYLEFYGHYQFRKFLLTQIYKLHLFGLKEDLFVNYLHTPTSNHYTELGYSLDNILRVLRLEFVTSFRDGSYEDFGVRLSVTTNFGRN